MWTIQQLMTPRVHTVPHSMPVATCLSLMKQRGFRHLPVLDGLGALIGVASEYELLRRARTGGATDWVGSAAHPCRPPASPTDDAVQVVARQLEDGRDCTVVINPVGQPIGVFTETDGLELATLCLKPWMQVAEVMTDGELYVVGGVGEADRCLAFMLDQRIRHLMVVDDTGALTGVVSHRDLVGRASARIATLTGDTVHTTSPETPLHTAVKLMAELHIGCLPVLGEDRVPLGILTRMDVMRAVSRQLIAASQAPATGRPDRDPAKG